MRRGALPVEGFVLAGGQSRRMGRDKALTNFHGKPLIAWAVDRLREGCSLVRICGDRPDLAPFGQFLGDWPGLFGPAAGIAAGLGACGKPWALFTPVDVPLVPWRLLGHWVEAVGASGASGSVLEAGGRVHPVICLMHRELAAEYRVACGDANGRLLGAWELLEAGGAGVRRHAAEDFVSSSQRQRVVEWFRNLNTPSEVAAAEEGSWLGGE